MEGKRGVTCLNENAVYKLQSSGAVWAQGPMDSHSSLPMNAKPASCATVPASVTSWSVTHGTSVDGSVPPRACRPAGAAALWGRGSLRCVQLWLD